MPQLIGPDEARAVAEAALDVPGADVEVLFMHEWGGLTRFASSAIHQSTWREDTALRVRVVTQGRTGVASTNDFSKDGARAAASNALEMASVAAPDPMYPGMAPKAEVPEKPDAFDDATAASGPEERAEAVAALVGNVGQGFRAAGAFETMAAEVALSNSAGQFCYAPYTRASVSTVVSGGEGGAGTAEVTEPRVGQLDPVAVGRRAFEKARDSQHPQDLDPGRYEVVLEPMAADTLVAFLAYIGLGGRAIVEGRSPFSGKDGEQVCATSVDIYDDALSPSTLGLPFDFEGTPKKRTPLIEHGRFLSGVFDRRTAKMAGKTSTAHALPAPNPEGAFPLNLFLGTGQATVEEMVKATSRGLLITRFHYSNVVHPIETVITGMTRDGTWLIEDGEVRHPVKNLRFTQSILEALSAVDMIGRESALVSEFFFAATRVPALRIGSFNFSGKSDH
jgi:predicted Zn-dependent protease